MCGGWLWSARVQNFDVIIVGGGPAGATCARFLRRGGARVAVLDRARFPRVKLCAGWLSAPIWQVLELSPRDYDRGLWEWSRCHVHFGGRTTSARQRGYFIRRYEFDDFLLARSGAEVHQDVAVKEIARDGRDYIVGEFRAPVLIGAGGTHCPVARTFFPSKPRPPVGVQELEFQTELAAVAATRAGGDGEPELLLHADLRGYSWNVPKSDWLNVGCGTVNPRQVRQAWQQARQFFTAQGHLPAEAGQALEHVKGHSYYLFDPAHLEACTAEGVALVGDSLGLAQPLTAEGILPAVLSGRLAAEAVLAGDVASYRARLKSHPVARDYTAIYYLREAGAALAKRSTSPRRPRLPAAVTDAGSSMVASAFAWMFAGKALPAARIVGVAAKSAYCLARRSEETRDAQ